MSDDGQSKVSRLAMLTSRSTGLQIQVVIFLAALLLPGTASPRLAAQTNPDFLKLASDTSRRITKTHTQRILIAPLEGCLLDMTICNADEATLRAALENDIPGVQFINHDKLVSQVKEHGLLAIDAFDSLVVRSLGTETGAETLVSVNVKWDGDHYQLVNRIFGPSTGDIEPRFQARVSPDTGNDNPLLYKDEETGVFLAVPKRRTSGFPAFRYPECKLCGKFENYVIPYDYQEFRMRVTITELGGVEQIAVLSPGPSLASEKTAEDMKKNWRFTPAIDSERKPFSIRVNLKVTIWQNSIRWDISY